jgi:hypothetical protein
MNNLIALRTTFILSFIFIGSLSLKAQVDQSYQDTTHKILVVRPNQPAAVPAKAHKTTTNTSTTPDPSDPDTFVAPPANATQVKANKTTTPANTSTTPDPADPDTFTTPPANTTPPPVNYTTPAASGNTPPAKVYAPTTAERTGAPTYMNPIPPKKHVTLQTSIVPANSTYRQSVPVTAPAAGKPNTTPAITVTQTVVKGPGVIEKFRTDTVTVIKKDTVFVAKHDTVTIKPPKHKSNKILFAELGGPGLAISINYDARFGDEKDGLGFRVGMGYFFSSGNTVFTVPVQVNYLIGSNGKYIELGAGTTFLNSTGDNTDGTFIFDRVRGLVGTATVGIRFEPEKSLNFRVGFVPIFYDEGVIYAGGLSLGYTF